MSSSHRIRKSLALLLLTGIWGCSVPKDVANLTPSQTPVLSSTEKGALATQDFIQGEWPGQGWWEMFHDPQLNGFILKAIKDNPTLKKAEAQVKLAQQVTKQKKSVFLPELDALAQTSWNYLARNSFIRSLAPNIPPTYDETTVGFNFNYEFDFWGKFRNLFDAALGREKASIADAAQAALILSISVAEAYYSIQTELAKLDILKETLADRGTLLDLRSFRKNHGLDNQIQENNSFDDINTIKKKILQTEQLIEVEIHLLKMLMGEGPEAPVVILRVEELYEGPFTLPSEISLNLVARRPDLMAQIWRVEAAAKEIKVAKKDFYPNVNLGAFGGFDSLQFDNLFTWANKTGTLLPAIRLPIFTGGLLQANLGVKAYAFEEAVRSYDDLVLKAAKEVADQITILHKVNEQRRIQKEILETKNHNFSLTALRFKQGLSTFANVLQSDEEVLNQELVAVELDFLRLVSTLKLIRALGGGYMTPGEIPSPTAGG